uniref:SH2 domain-containing protein n=1 Tax=Globodera pallida TaxID=36090 RepID=A0A183BL72_GLOPA
MRRTRKRTAKESPPPRASDECRTEQSDEMRLQQLHDGLTWPVEQTPSLLLSHQLRKVCCAVCRVQTAQLAYITREQHSHYGHHVPGRKQCHAFRVGTPLHAQQIQTALADAFRQQQRNDDDVKMAVMTNAGDMLNCPIGGHHHQENANDGTMLMTWHPPADGGANSLSTLPPASFSSALALPEVNGTRENVLLATPLKRGTPSPFSSQMRLSSSSLLQRIFGGGSTTPKKQLSVAAACSPAKKMMTPSTTGFRFRKPRWPLTPFRSSTASVTTPKCAVGQSPQSLRWHAPSPATAAEVPAESPKKADEGEMSGQPHAVKVDEQLVYDDRIKEWIYPMDAGAVLEELQRLAYFCRPQEKEIVMGHLRAMPAGHFTLRLSGTRRRCLALSIRVEKDEKNPKGIAHYLVLRNEHGFRIKGSKRYFQSLPMLITHHSVMTDQLPCRLLLSDWRWTRDETHRRRQSSGGSTLAVLRAREEDNGNTTNMMPNTVRNPKMQRSLKTFLYRFGGEGTPCRQWHEHKTDTGQTRPL